MRAFFFVISLVLLSGCQSLPLLDTVIRQGSGCTFEKIDGPRGDVVLSIVSDSNGMVFAGMRGKGVFRSTDGGNSWEATALKEGAVYPLYVTATGKLFAFIRKPFFDRMIAVSTDQGHTWESLPEEYDRYIGSTVIRQWEGSLYSEGMDENRVGGAGLHQSTDDGVTWTTLQRTPPHSERCHGEYPLEILSDTAMFTQCPYGIFHSSDHGISWRKLDLPFGYFSGLSIDPLGGVITEAMDSLMSPGPRSLIRIDPSGDSWTTAPFTQRFLLESPSIVLQSGRVLSGKKSSSMGIWYSADSGQSWQETSVITGAVNDFCETPDGTAFAAMHGAIMRSVDDGRTWMESSDGLGQRGITHLFRDDAGNTWAGTALGGLYRSADDGGSWMRSTPGLHNIKRGFSLAPGHIVIGSSSSAPNDIYRFNGSVLHQDFICTGLSVHVSHDTGKTWSTLDVRSVDNWAMEPGKGMHVFTGGRENNFSTDGGDTWSTDPMFSEARDIHATTSGIYAVRGDTLFHRRYDAEETTMLLTERFLQDVFTMGHTIICLTPWKLMRSTDAGESWDAWRKDRDDLRFEHLLTVNDSTVAIIGKRPYIYLSMDAGATWREIQLAIGKHGHITSAVLDSKGHLFLGTTSGLFRSRTPL
ncbi:hypothetical protein KQI65_13805 [bacterium]|nr:hypothetical protein [bacterium]